MERNTLARRRQKDSTRPPMRLPHKRTQSEATHPHPHPRPPPLESPQTPTSHKIRTENGFFEGQQQGHRRNDTVPTVGKQTVYDEDNPKNFTVVNVGAGGVLYLKPSRVPGPNPNFAPATPPAISEDASSYCESSQHDERPLLTGSDESIMSGTRTPRPAAPERSRTVTASHVRSSQPPISLQNPRNRRGIGRSLSCSTVSDRSRASRYDANEFNLDGHGHGRPPRRRRSSIDLGRGQLDVYIPHYRLGTPRFSDRGTAYLHYSMNTMASVPSSVLSAAEYDKLFPVPPGRGISFLAHHSGGQLSLHPGTAYTRSTINKSPYASARPSTVGIITPGDFDKIEHNLDNPVLVRYHPATGRIVAATPARLIAQITSPDFLDYELLADFFLTFRCFMQSQDLLEYLFARLRWSFISGNDAGRIVRVRSFVALRHWILNYFADDFMMDAPFRRLFCDRTNELAASLRQRPDHGGGDMNILFELKKCWRRTCAVYWPLPEDLEIPPDTDITPGGEMYEERPSAPSQLSLPLSARPTTARGSIFEVTTIQLPPQPEPLHRAVDEHGPAQRTTTITIRTASIPASPLSHDSLEVLSCSVPFLRNIRPTARAREKAAAREPRAPPKSMKNGARPGRHHKRSGSFSDALRDKRTPLSSPKADKIELKDLPSFSVTGGLVRGLLLQPSPPSVDTHVPVTPGPDLNEGILAGASDSETGERLNHNIAMKKFVGEVRRALSSRKAATSRSPARSTSSKRSAGSRGPDRPTRHVSRLQPDWQQLPGPDRLDVLGLKIETSYKSAWDESSRSEVDKDSDHTKEKTADPERAETPRPSTALRDKGLPSPPPIPESREPSFDPRNWGRLDSHVTNGSRSIVIVDATGAPELPMMSGGLGHPSLSTMSTEFMPIPLFRNRDDVGTPRWSNPAYASSETPRTVAGDPKYHWRSSDARLHDLLATPSQWSTQDRSSRYTSDVPSEDMRPRQSSDLEPNGLNMHPVHHQLRRVPGGNLRDVNHVRSLEMTAAPVRPRSEGSLASRVSVASRAYVGPSRGSTENGGVLLPDGASQKAVGRTSVTLLATHSSQPNLRASFQEEARKLKGLPDDDGIGGIEDALLKLEGKIPSPSSSSSERSGSRMSQSKATETHDAETPDTKITPDEPSDDGGEKDPYRLPPPHALKELPMGDYRAVYGEIPMKISPSINKKFVQSPVRTETQGASIFHLSMSEATHASGFPLPNMGPPDRANTESTASTSVVPLAARLTRYPLVDPYTAVSTPESFHYVQSPQSIHSSSMLFPSYPSARYPSFRPGPWDSNGYPSFLLDDNQSLSDISTDIADSEEVGVRSFFFDDTGNGGAHAPIRTFQPLYGTPPSTMGGATDQSPDMRQLLPRHNGYNGTQPARTLKEKISNPALQTQAANQPFPRRPQDAPRSVTSPTNTLTLATFDKHMPFILAFESEVIAEQLTIIEKDALDEVDWKDLISLNWQQSPPHVRNWVDFLNKETTNGIDIVIARFNLVVKWCISEIVLTEVPSERARAITKFIHIASHCHRMRNYASLYQITLALHSNEITRLRDTWALVTLREKNMLEHLEHLCRPMRNFHNLRAEMETAMPGHGVIPFIGLYTHDLMFNALKSARINAPAPGKEPLVNFERYQTAAAIVKNLLRLIEASAKYTFHPEPEALSRCLWIAALEDQEIAARSIALEKD